MKPVSICLSLPLLLANAALADDWPHWMGPTRDNVWVNKRNHGLSPVNVQPLVHAGTMYGFDQGGKLMAIELPSGIRLWETTAPLGKRRASCGTAFIVRQADRYWLFNEHGELLIVKLTPAGYDEIDRHKVIEPTNRALGRNVVWCMPAFANRRMFVRNDKECLCVDLAANGPSSRVRSPPPMWSNER